MKSVECWVQIACPRLSIDWGMSYSKPLLTCYEAFVALGEAEWREEYPMDWYSNEGGVWSNGQNWCVCCRVVIFTVHRSFITNHYGTSLR